LKVLLAGPKIRLSTRKR